MEPLRREERRCGERRRPGRPPAIQRSASVSAWVPTPVYDRLVRAAHRQDMSVSALVRTLLILRLPKGDG